MNLILLFDSDFHGPSSVRLSGRRFEHLVRVLKPALGNKVRVGLVKGNRGFGIVTSLSSDFAHLEVTLDEPPPPELDITLLLALPRPKCLRRILQGVVSFGVKRIVLFQVFKVEKSYWQTPFLSEISLQEQVLLGLEQGEDTTMPHITLERYFKPFLEDRIPMLMEGRRALVAHPAANNECPCAVREPLTLAIGPEGGFTDYEFGALQEKGFDPFRIGPRPLRTEQAVPALLGRLMAFP